MALRRLLGEILPYLDKRMKECSRHYDEMKDLKIQLTFVEGRKIHTQVKFFSFFKIKPLADF